MDQDELARTINTLSAQLAALQGNLAQLQNQALTQQQSQPQPPSIGNTQRDSIYRQTLDENGSATQEGETNLVKRPTVPAMVDLTPVASTATLRKTTSNDPINSKPSNNDSSSASFVDELNDKLKSGRATLRKTPSKESTKEMKEESGGTFPTKFQLRSIKKNNNESQSSAPTSGSVYGRERGNLVQEKVMPGWSRKREPSMTTESREDIDRKRNDEQSMLRETSPSQMTISNVIEEALKAYLECMDKPKLKGLKYIPKATLARLHALGQKQALAIFTRESAVASPEIIQKLRKELETKLKSEFSRIAQENDDNRNHYITEAINDATTNFRQQLEALIPLDDTKFYEDSLIEKMAQDVQADIMDEFYEKFPNETEEDLAASVQSLESNFESILQSHLIKNENIRASAEQSMNPIMEELLANFQLNVEVYFASNEYEYDAHKLDQACEDLKSIQLHSFQEQGKSGTGAMEFHNDCSNTLDMEMDSIFSQFRNQHQVRIQRMVQDAEASLNNTIAGYAEELGAVAQGGGMNEAGLRMLHSVKAAAILDQFHRNNPFPEGSGVTNELEARLNARLQQVLANALTAEIKVKKETVTENVSDPAKLQSFQYYDSKMRNLFQGVKFISDENLQKEHERFQTTAIRKFEEVSQIGASGNMEQIKQEIQVAIDKRFESIKAYNDSQRNLVVEDAKKYVQTCQGEYNHAMQMEFDNCTREVELEACHDEEKAKALSRLQHIGSSWGTGFIQPFEKLLERGIDEKYLELKEMLYRKTNEQGLVDIIFKEAKVHYHEEMRKHLRNNPYMDTATLQGIHEQLRKNVIEECKRTTTLSRSQWAGLTKELDELLAMYLDKNSPNAYTGQGLGAIPQPQVPFNFPVNHIPSPTHVPPTAPGYMTNVPAAYGYPANDFRNQQQYTANYYSPNPSMIIGWNIPVPEHQNNIRPPIGVPAAWEQRNSLPTQFPRQGSVKHAIPTSAPALPPATSLPKVTPSSPAPPHPVTGLPKLTPPSPAPPPPPPVARLTSATTSSSAPPPPPMIDLAPAAPASIPKKAPKDPADSQESQNNGPSKNDNSTSFVGQLNDMINAGITLRKAPKKEEKKTDEKDKFTFKYQLRPSKRINNDISKSIPPENEFNRNSNLDLGQVDKFGESKIISGVDLNNQIVFENDATTSSVRANQKHSESTNLNRRSRPPPPPLHSKPPLNSKPALPNRPASLRSRCSSSSPFSLDLSSELKAIESMSSHNYVNISTPTPPPPPPPPIPTPNIDPISVVEDIETEMTDESQYFPGESTAKSEIGNRSTSKSFSGFKSAATGGGAQSKNDLLASIRSFRKGKLKTVSVTEKKRRSSHDPTATLADSIASEINKRKKAFQGEEESDDEDEDALSMDEDDWKD